MSAFMVDHEHIDAILSVWIALADRRTGPATYASSGLVYERQSDATAKGRMLLRENLASVSARYPADPSDGLIVDLYTFQSCPIDLYRFREIIGRAFRLLACYEYQACEHAGWETSEACKFIESIHSELITRVAGYNDPGLWGGTDRDVFKLDRKVAS